MRTLEQIAGDVASIRHAFSIRDARRAVIWALATEIRAHARKPKHFKTTKSFSITTEDDQARDYPAGTKVFLYDNEDAGVQRVKVALVETPDCWICSYPTEDQARAACKQHGWVIDEVRSAGL